MYAIVLLQKLKIIKTGRAAQYCWGNYIETSKACKHAHIIDISIYRKEIGNRWKNVENLYEVMHIIATEAIYCSSSRHQRWPLS